MDGQRAGKPTGSEQPAGAQASGVVHEALAATGLTAPAFARRLGVSAEHVQAWADGIEPVPAAVVAAAEALLIRTKMRAASGPRLPRPGLPSQIVCADALTHVATLPEQSIELILSDIPYGIGLDDWDVLHDNANSAYLGASHAQKTAGAIFKKRHKPINGWSAADHRIPGEYQAWCSRWAAEWLRVLRPGGSALVFAGRRFAHRCAVALEDAGFHVRDVLAWERPQAPLRAQRLSVIFRKRGDGAEAIRWQDWRVGNLRPLFEPIIWCFKPYPHTIADNMLDHGVGAYNLSQHAIHSRGDSNILRHGFAPAERGHHDAQKPVALLENLIALCTLPGQMVLDPFAGSGSTAVAAARLGRRYLAIEQEAGLCDIAHARIAALAHEQPSRDRVAATAPANHRR